MNWSDIFLSIITGFVGSILVVLFLYRLRPKIEISKYISERIVDGETRFGFKLINRSPYAILDVRIALELITARSVPDGQVNSCTKVDLINDHFYVVQKFDRSDRDANFAFRVNTCENLQAMWNGEGQYLRISVVGRHALSGFYGVFQQRFYTRGDIKFGSHRFGIGLDVLPTA